MRCFRNPVVVGLVVCAAFILVFEAYYWRVPPVGIPRTPLSAEELIALMTGAVTSASLVAIYAQIAQAQRQATTEAARDAANLQSVYYSTEMVNARLRADLCLMDLAADVDATVEMVRYWVDAEAYELPEKVVGKACSLHHVTWQQANEAMTVMVGFYVRVQHYSLTHAPTLREHERLELMRLLGWPGWRARGLLSLAKRCDQYKPSHGNKIGLYFIERLRDLDEEYLELLRRLGPDTGSPQGAMRELPALPDNLAGPGAVFKVERAQS